MIKRGDIVVNQNRDFIGIFHSWRDGSRNLKSFWSAYLDIDDRNQHVYIPDEPEKFSSSVPATEKEIKIFKRQLLNRGYYLIKGKLVKSDEI